MLAVEGLNAWYGQAQALFDVSLSVGEGELVGLLGPNGAGKSTLLQSLIGIGPRAQGRITWQNAPIQTWTTHRRAQAGLGFVAEDRRLFTGLSVKENLWIAAHSRTKAQTTPAQRFEDVMALFPQLQTMLHRPASQMSVDRYGIPHPANGPEIVPELLLVPLNAFDAAGFRIGYGGGYFDRTLARLSPRPVAVGVGYECGRVASALPEGHDLPMDWIVSEAGCARSAGRPA